MNYTPTRELFRDFDALRGGVVLVSSNVIRLLSMQKLNESTIDPNRFIDALQDQIGVNGTLLFPTYNWDFCEGKTYSYRKSPSKTGSLGTAALKRSDFKRTRHAIYSFAVWGKDADYLYSLENTDSFGRGSPFEYLYERRGINLLIDIDYQRSFTYAHFVEQCANVPYRYLKAFSANYVDENGNESMRAYTMLVRDLDLETQTDIKPIGEVFEQKGAANKRIINGVGFIVVDLFVAFDLIKDDITNNAARKLTRYKGQIP
jgi:aminoglycoside 3-N-acetyltransferase